MDPLYTKNTNYKERKKKKRKHQMYPRPNT